MLFVSIFELPNHPPQGFRKPSRLAGMKHHATELWKRQADHLLAIAGVRATDLDEIHDHRLLLVATGHAYSIAQKGAEWKL